jgi:hypothetical protein
MLDNRKFVAKFSRDLPIMIAKNNTSLNKDVEYDILCQWTEQNKTYTLAEIVFSKIKAASIIRDSQDSIMNGPDMYRVYDENKNIIMNIWQAVRMENTIEVQICNKSILLRLSDSKNESVHQINSIINNKISEIWTSNMNSQFRTNGNNMTFAI